MATCPECGSDVDPDDRFCTACGTALDDVEFDEGAGESQGPSRVNVPANPFTLDVFEFSFKYPLANGFKSLVLGALLFVLSILVVPMFMLTGYQYRVGRAAAIEEMAPPEIGDWWGLLVDGLRLFVAIAVLLVPAMAAFLGLLVADQTALAMLVYFPSLLFVAAIPPVFYGTGSVRGVFGNLRFVRFVATAKFWIGLAYQLGISFVLQMAFFLVSLLLIITIIGIIPWLFLIPVFLVYSTFVQAALWGRIYHDAAEDGVVDEIQNPGQIESRW
ncbi:DUF4013 domain-containing protein [Salinarchaeum laminariae]|uniref:DUF4013 domain-containing protein n=1 Tax=Salinarchaeum laminariae TaxID=869888 RepID=UPI0020C08699|nr:DUF4013 domain-containing protein [Salinarchaeum laminariae]